MADKGGKKFSVPTSKKTTATKSISKKKDVALKGKDDSSSKKGINKVNLLSDSDDSSDENVRMSTKASEKGKGSFETPVGKGDWGKGGKDDSMGKAGGKSGLTREPPPKVFIPEVELEIVLSKNAKCLMDCEAAVVLQGIQDHLSFLSEDPKIKIPESFSKGLQYAKAGSHYKDPGPVRRDLSMLKRNKVTDGEICMIGNICPETVDEVFALVPSLKINEVTYIMGVLGSAHWLNGLDLCMTLFWPPFGIDYRANRKKNEEPIRDSLYNLAKHKSSK